MRRCVFAAVACALVLGAPSAAFSEAHGGPHGAKANAKDVRADCLAHLDALGVSYREAEVHPGIAIPVEVTGPLGGITYVTWEKRALVLDCSLVYSLAVAGKFFTDGGAREAFYSSAYQRRNIRGTSRPSKHSYGLALDVHRWKGDGAGGSALAMSVEDDYEQGLGDDEDCVGQPLTPAGATLRTFFCRLDRSGLFRIILTPDYDEDHFNHFHIEALPWEKRTDVTAVGTASSVGR